METQKKTHTITLRINEDTLNKILVISKKYNISMSKILFYFYLSDDLTIIEEKTFDNKMTRECSDMVNGFNQIQKFLQKYKLFFQVYFFYNIQNENKCFKKLSKLVNQNYKICKNLENQFQEYKRRIYFVYRRGLLKDEIISFIQEYYPKKYIIELQDELKIKFKTSYLK